MCGVSKYNLSKYTWNTYIYGWTNDTYLYIYFILFYFTTIYKRGEICLIKLLLGHLNTKSAHENKHEYLFHFNLSFYAKTINYYLIELNWTELNWSELNWAELNWTELNWMELYWTELNWI